MPFVTVPALNNLTAFQTIKQGKNMSEAKRILIETVAQISIRRCWHRGCFASGYRVLKRKAESNLLAALSIGSSMDEIKQAIGNYKQLFNGVQHRVQPQGNTNSFMKDIRFLVAEPFSMKTPSSLGKVSKAGGESMKLPAIVPEVYQQESDQYGDRNPLHSSTLCKPGFSASIPVNICTRIKKIMEKAGYNPVETDMPYGVAWAALLACVRQGGQAYMKRMQYLKQVDTLPLPGVDDKHLVHPFFDAVTLSMTSYISMDGYKKGIGYPGRQEVAFPGRVIGSREPDYQVPVVKHAFISECIPETIIRFLQQTRENNKGITFGVMIHYSGYTTSIGFDGNKWLAADYDSHYYTEHTDLLYSFLDEQRNLQKDGKIIAAMEVVTGNGHSLNINNNDLVVNTKKSVSISMVLHLALQYGDVSVTTDCIKVIRLQTHASEALLKLLTCKNAKGTPGFFMALVNGHPETITAFIRESAAAIALLHLSEEQKTELLRELLTSKTSDGVPGFFMALQHGYPEAVTAFIKAIATLSLPKEEKTRLLCELLTCENNQGLPGFYMTLQDGYPETTIAFIRESAATVAMLHLPEAQKARFLYMLLISKTPNDIPGFFITLQQNHHETIAAFIQESAVAIATLSLPDMQKAGLLCKLLTSKRPDPDGGVPGFYMALQQGYTDAIIAFIKTSAAAITTLSLPKEEEAKLLCKLLACKADDGTPGFYVSLQYGYPEAITAFIQESTTVIGALSISEEQKTELLHELLACKTTHGTPGLYMALHKGHSDAITAFIKASALAIAELSLPKTEKAKVLYGLLACKAANDSSMPGLFATLHNGYSKAITAFIQESAAAVATLLLPEEQKAELLYELLSSKDAYGTPGFYMTLEKGYSEAITTFIQASAAAITTYPLLEEQKAKLLCKLLACKRADGIPGFYMTLQYGHTNAITAFIKASAAVITRLSLPEAERAKLLYRLLGGKKARGVSGFLMLLQNGYPDAITTFIQESTAAITTLLLPEEQKAKLLCELLASKAIDGIPGFYITLHDGHTDAVTAFIQESTAAITTLLLPEEQKAKLLCELLVCKASDGTPGLYITLHNGHADAVTAFIRESAAVITTLLLPEEQKAKLLSELLACKASDGTPGLYITLHNGQAEVVTAFVRASTAAITTLLLSEEQKTKLLCELLTCKAADGIPGFYITLYNGHADVVTAFIQASAAMIATLSKLEQKRAEIIYGLFDDMESDNKANFLLALEQGGPAVKKAFTEGIDKLPLSAEQKETLKCQTAQASCRIM